MILANKKKSLVSGDGKEMLLAREEYLQSGIYDFLVEEILSVAGKSLRKNVLEIGCGTGFYLNRIADRLKPEGVYGSDVSKEAIKMCAKKYPQYSFLVDNAFDLNLKGETIDLLLSVFSPFEHKEVERVLSPGGDLIVVRPGQNHLRELYQMIGLKTKEKGSLGFEKIEKISEKTVVKKVQISAKQISLLIRMTPLFWNINKEKFDIDRLNCPELTLEFQVWQGKKVG